MKQPQDNVNVGVQLPTQEDTKPTVLTRENLLNEIDALRERVAKYANAPIEERIGILEQRLIRGIWKQFVFIWISGAASMIVLAGIIHHYF